MKNIQVNDKLIVGIAGVVLGWSTTELVNLLSKQDAPKIKIQSYKYEELNGELMTVLTVSINEAKVICAGDAKGTIGEINFTCKLFGDTAFVAAYHVKNLKSVSAVAVLEKNRGLKS